MPELALQRRERFIRDGGKSLLDGMMPGADQAAQRPLRLHGPDRARVGLGAVFVVAQQVCCAGLVPRDVLPPAAEVILVAVGDDDPGESGEDPASSIESRLRVPSQNAEYVSVKAPVVALALVLAHSEKEQAAATWKKAFGFHPLVVFADHGAAGSGEALAIMLRPGNAGSNTTARR